MKFKIVLLNECFLTATEMENGTERKKENELILIFDSEMNRKTFPQLRIFCGKCCERVTFSWNTIIPTEE